RHRCVDLCLLCLSVFEEIHSYLREECVCQHILILLDPLLTLFAERIQLVRDEIRRTARNDLRVFSEDLLLQILVHRFCRCPVSSCKDVFCLFCSHFIALAHQDVEHCLGSHDLGRRC